MKVLTNAHILPMDGAMQDIASGWIAIDGDQIAAIGEGAVPAGYAGAKVQDMGGDLVMPGMVNPHCHLPMTLFRGLGEDIDDRLFRYILPLERALVDANVVAIGAQLGALESIRGGVTTIADMYYFEDQIGDVLDTAGLRAIVGQTLANFAAPDHSTMDEGFARLDALADRFSGHARITASAAPHAPYSTGPQVMARVADWATTRGLRVQMHLAETRDEVAWAAREHGCTTVELADQIGLLSPSLTAAHVMYPSDSDLDLIAARGVGVAHNARSNGKAGRGIAPVMALRSRGVAVGLATDGPMSGNTLDVFAQMAPAAMFQKIATGSRGAISCRDVVRMATIEAAQALGIGQSIGSLEVGKKADLIRLSLADPRLHPIYDIWSMLVYAALPSDVRGTMVGGEWLMQDRVVTTIDSEKALRDALAVAGRFADRIRQIDEGLH